MNTNIPSVDISKKYLDRIIINLMSQEMLGSLPSKLATTIPDQVPVGLGPGLMLYCQVINTSPISICNCSLTQISSQEFLTDEAEEFLVQSLKVLLESKSPGE